MTGKIIPDPVDVRDLIYRPSLALLPDQFLCAAIDPRIRACSGLFKVRQQGKQPICIGEALAALIDIQRIESFQQRGDVHDAQAVVLPASATMLQAMALVVENTDTGSSAPDIHSLRSGLKGFYNTGVCTEKTWRQEVRGKSMAAFDDASVTVMREARNVTLGAYYRVASIINDYHSALAEAGALYVAAELHGGWSHPPNGVINHTDAGAAPAAAHAFVIVGYNSDGFLVLNSWGKAWGGYTFAPHARLPGVALWSYADWAATVLDAWVLRLAAPTPASFPDRKSVV